MPFSTTNTSPNASPTICGWHDSGPSKPGSERKLMLVEHSTGSTLPTTKHRGESCACGTTGSLVTFADGGFATIIGEPRWKDADLQELARKEGYAEALAKSYEMHGADCLEQIRGGFAATIVDPTTKTTMIAVDRLGRYCMYYENNEQGIIFGSTAGTVSAISQKSSTLDNMGLYSYVYFHMVPSPLTIYRGIKKLTPGQSLVACEGKVHLKTFWSPSFSSPVNQSFDQAGKQLRQILNNSVERAAQGEPAVGAFLSGGLDSSTVSGMLAGLSERQVHAYAIGFSAEGYDEIPYARITARHFGIQLHEYYVTPEDIVEALPSIAASYDEPFGNSSALPAYFCAKFAAEDGVRRLLAGDGGDELFAGNERYAKQRVFNRYSQAPKALRNAVIEPLLTLLPVKLPLVEKARSYITQANTPLPDRLQSYNFLHRLKPEHIFSDDVLASVDTELPLQLQRERFFSPKNASMLNRMLFFDWKFTLADNDLRKVNKMCALAGIEVTYPMLDDELLDFSCTIPDAWKMKGGKLRHFYKESLRGWLPDETIDKKKHGFGLPFGVWMQAHKPLQSLAYDSLLSLKQRHFFKSSFIDDAINLHRSGHAAYYGELVWILMVLELWLQQHGRDE